MTRFAPLITAIALCTLASACLPESNAQTTDTSPGVVISDPSLIETQKAACLKAGGRFEAAGLLGLMTCFTTPKDANKSCSKSTDCSSECLARSRTCAPIKPLFGCNELLDSRGRPVTLCVD